MQLDRGICTVYTQTDISASGGMPRYERRIKAQSYYGELSFETSPQWPTEHREETKTAARVRILQSRGVTKDYVAELHDFTDDAEDVRVYRITRAYHGVDDESGEKITDLTLEAMTT